jgi:hypothetical protein
MDYGISCLFRTAVRSVIRGWINEESTEINLANNISLVWLLGNRIVLESATEAKETLGRWRGGVIGWWDESTVFGFCGFEWNDLLRLRNALNYGQPL